MDNQEEKKYVFSCLVDGKDDVGGQVAYAIYKFEKRQHITDVLDGREMNDDEKEEYRKAHTTKECIEGYLERSEIVLEKYAQKQLKVIADGIEKDLKKKQKENFKKYLGGLILPTWLSILLGVLESVIGAIIIGIIVMLLAWGGEFNIGNVKISYQKKPEEGQTLNKDSNDVVKNDSLSDMEFPKIINKR